MDLFKLHLITIIMILFGRVSCKYFRSLNSQRIYFSFVGDCTDVLYKLINLQLRQVRYFHVIVGDRHDYCVLRSTYRQWYLSRRIYSVSVVKLASVNSVKIKYLAIKWSVSRYCGHIPTIRFCCKEQIYISLLTSFLFPLTCSEWIS